MKGEVVKFSGSKGAKVTLLEESIGLLWPGQTALQLRESCYLMLPAGLGHPWVGVVLRAELDVSQTLAHLFHCCCSAERDYFAQDCDGNKRRTACVLPTYVHIHS